MPSGFRRKLCEAKHVFTFRDFVIIPGRAEVEPSQVDISSFFTKNIRVFLPFVSSPMDTVTESEMAIALARLGGIGVIHRNMTIEEQVEQVRRVKRAESFIIKDVFTIGPESTVRQAIDIMTKNNISGLPVIENDRLVGILTKRDVSFADLSWHVRDVMTKEVVTAGPSITVEEAKKVMHDRRVEKLPVVDGNGRLLGLITIKDVYSREKYSTATRDSEGRLRVAAAISPFDVERARALDRYIDALVCDVAHFHNVNALKSAKRIVKEVNADFVIGNIGTGDGLRDSLEVLDKVDAVRVGIGSGSTCITSMITKAAAPTLFAVAEVADAMDDLNAKVPIIADGGVRNPGDAVLALAVGASTVMMGMVFAGCSESPGNLVKIGGKYYKPLRGMGSLSAREKRFIIDRYATMAKGIAEGVEGYVSYRGDARTFIEEFASGLKASFGYSGARNIPELWAKASLGLVTEAGLDEMKPHDIILPGE
ncbi:MAG: IMP dehydrogenase [Nitrososphaeria archaeon]